MAEFRLRLALPSADEIQATAGASFYWINDRRATLTTHEAHGSYLGPFLGAFGQVKDRNIDLVRIATAVFAADRTTPRKAGGSNWNRRPIRLTVPVLNAPAWTDQAADLKSVIDFLTGDDWIFEFITEDAPAETTALTPARPTRVVLLSGGADSGSGALISAAQLEPGETHSLVSHFSSTNLPATQRDVAARVHAFYPAAQLEHRILYISPKGKRIDGANYRSESTSRSRSLLFLALGLAIASVHEVPLWIPENGFASLNPPLGRQRLGSLSTRTTHPLFLEGLQRVVTAVGGHGEIQNPFAALTKGEMFRRVAHIVGDDPASQFLSSTISCSHTDQRHLGVRHGVGCGVCFGCLVRRASFKAAGIKDVSRYMNSTANSEAVQAWLAGKSLEVAVERAASRGIRSSDVIAMGLPTASDINDVIDLCRRGLAELGGLTP